ncbi:MAG: hypothetical protein IBJ18_10485 [Phycisphaerales bacterium]|nr:hypothetical protein [Phycisphaerales bacterium]
MDRPHSTPFPRVARTLRALTPRTLRFACAAATSSSIFFAAHTSAARTSETTASSSQAPADVSAPKSLVTGRVVRFFDFEEDAFNPDPVPQYWFRAQDDPRARARPGFPIWNEAQFSNTFARSGVASVMLPTDGGSTSLRLGAGVIPIFPSADYVVTAAIRTKGLRAARGCIAARLLDAEKNPITASEIRSETIESPLDWTPVSIKVPGRWPEAAYLQIDLELLQPAQFTSSTLLGRHTVWDEDISGAVYIDDVGVFQLPRVELTPTAPAGVVSAPDTVSFTGIVRDLTGEDLTAQLALRDIHGNVVDTHTIHLGPGGGELDWTPRITALGWYEASMHITTGPHIVGSSSCAVLAVPAFRHRANTSAPAGAVFTPPASQRHDVSMGLVLCAANEDQLSRTQDLLTKLNLHALTIPLVSNQSTFSYNFLKPILDRLLSSNTLITLWLPSLPSSLATDLRVDPTDAMILADHPEAQWLPFLHPLLDTFGQRITRWQIGIAPAIPTWRGPELSRRLSLLRDALERSIPDPRIALPWNSQVAWPNPAPPKNAALAADTLSLVVPASFSPAAAADAVRTWARQAPLGTELHAILQPLDSDVSIEDQITDLMQRTALIWRALEMGNENAGLRAQPRISLPDPFARQDSGSQHSDDPSPLVGVWANLNAHLVGRKVIAVLDNPSGLRCLLLSSPAPVIAGARPTGLIIAWADSSVSSAVLRGYFTAPESTLTAFDPFGNPSTVTPADSNGRYEITVGPTPILLEGVDSELARFSAGFEVSPNFVLAVAAVHEHEIILSNPWPVRITGEIHLPSQQIGVTNQPWRFTPTSPMPFSIAPGQQVRLPFAFSFSSGEEAGPRQLIANVKITADRPYPPMKLSAPITIGLNDIDMQVNVNLAPRTEGPDVVITATVINSGKSPRTLQVELVAAGESRQKLPVSNLGPGESAVRRFVIKNAAAKLSGKRIRCTLVDVDGLERLNKFVQAP